MKRLSAVGIAVTFIVLIFVPGISRAQGMIDLNTAGPKELEGLPGVGPEMAARIVAERDANGPYYSLDDLDRRLNVGSKTLAEWEGMVMQGSGKTATSLGIVSTDRIIFKNGDVINVDVATMYYEVQTSYASVALAKEQMWSISLEGGGKNIDTIMMRNGDQFSGTIRPDVIEVILSGGQKTKIPKGIIKSIQFKK